jgi:hypothetical protein
MEIYFLNPKILASVGLLLDVVGVAILFFYGLPPKIARDGNHFLTIGTNSNEKNREKRYVSYSNLGLTLLIFGFVLQTIAVWL